jgi:hypothetical protein
MQKNLEKEVKDNYSVYKRCLKNEEVLSADGCPRSVKSSAQKKIHRKGFQSKFCQILFKWQLEGNKEKNKNSLKQTEAELCKARQS